ncbi:putative tetratricopeptide-like helical domain superfamily [Dioscorea sansibarensis]
MQHSLFASRFQSSNVPRNLCLFDKFLSMAISCSVEALDFPEDSLHLEPGLLQNSIFELPNFSITCSVYPKRDVTASSYDIWQSAQVARRSRVQNYAKAGNLKAALDVLSLMNPSVLDYNALLHSYLKSSAVCVDKLASVFEGMERCGTPPNVWTFNILFNGLCKLGYLKDALYVLEEMRSNKFIPSFSSLMRLMKKSLGAWAFPSMCTPTIQFFLVYASQVNVTLLCLFSTSSEEKDLPMGGSLSTLEQMRVTGCAPTVVTYTVLIKFLCKHKKIEAALQILNMMSKKGCSPDLVTYNTLLHALCSLNRVSDAQDLIRFMEGKGTFPDQVTYCALATALLKAGKLRHSHDLLCRVVSSGGHFVDSVACNIYFHILCCDDRNGEAISKVSSMMEHGFVPTNVTYNTILKRFCRDADIVEALELLDNFKWESGGPDLISFNTILSAACRQGNASVIRSVLDRMGTKGFKLNIVGMTSLMQYYGKIGALVESYKLFEHMISEGQSPSTITYNVILGNLCRKGLTGPASKMFDELRMSGVSPDTTSYNILIHALVKKNDYVSVKNLLADMHNSGFAPDAFTYGSLCYALCKIGKVTNALQLEDWMVQNGLNPNISFYNNVLNALFRMARLWDVVLILRKMHMKGVEPDAISLNIFNRAMCKYGHKRFPKAMNKIKFIMNQ